MHESRYLLLENEPLDQADSLLQQSRWQEAKYLADVVTVHPGLGDAARAGSIKLAANSALESLPINSQDFLKGAMSGEADNGSALLGALALDLFVIGDVRDLLVQGFKELSNQDGDKIILALSATGLSLALLPEFHWAPAIMKGLKRSDSFSQPFTKSLTKLARNSLKTGDFKPLAGVVSNFARASSTLGLAPIKGAMKAVHSPDDLKKLAGAASISPQDTYAIAQLSGQRGIKILNKSGDNVSKVIQKLKRSGRLLKIAKKSFGALPFAFILSMLVLSLITLIVLRPGKSRW